MGYVPQPNSATALTICLGYVNLPLMGGSPPAPIPGTGCNLIGSAFTLNTSSGFTLSSNDIGNVIMVMSAGAGTPPDAEPLWTTIASVSGANSATLTDAAINNVSLVQAVIYRPLTQTNSFFNGAFVQMGSINYSSSLTVKTSFEFKVFSPNGSFVPQPGQPVLAFMTLGIASGVYSGSTTYSINDRVQYYGQWFISLQNSNTNNTPLVGTSTLYWATLDVFGGLIQQAKPSNLAASSAIVTSCECVDWSILLTRAILSLRSNVYPTFADGFTGNGTTKTFNTTFVPIQVTSITENSGGSVTSPSVGALVVAGGGNFSEFFVGDQLILVPVVGLTQYTVTISSITNENNCNISPSVPTGITYNWTGPSDQTGFVNTGTDIAGNYYATLSSGDSFNSLAPGDSFYINNSSGNSLAAFTIASVEGSGRLVYLTTSPGVRTNVAYRSTLSVTFGVEGGSSENYYWNPNSNKIISDPNYLPLPTNRRLVVVYAYIGISNFYNLSLGAIATSLLQALLPDGLAVITVTGPTIVNIQFTLSASFDSAIEALCQYVSNGATNFWYYPDSRRGIHIEEQAVTRIAPWNINASDLSDENVLLSVSNTRTLEKMANAALVSDSNVLGTSTITEDIPCSGQTALNTTWPIGQLVSLTFYPAPTFGLPPVPITFALLNTGSAIFGIYWAQNSTALTYGSGLTPLSGGYLEVIYYPILSTLTHYYNTAAIEARQAIEGGTGEYDLSQKPSSGTAPLLETEDISQIIAEYFSELSESVEAQTYRYGLVSGQGITVNLPDIASSGTYVVDRIDMKDQDNLLHWTVTCIRGAAIGDWKTAFRILTGAEQLTIGGGTGGNSVPPAWQPGYQTPITGDVLFSNLGFGIVQTYNPDAAGNPYVALSIYGNPPTPNYDVVVKIRRELVSGTVAQEASVVSTNNISFGGTPTAGQFNGRVISKLANLYGNNSLVPIADFLITSNDGAGNFTVTPDPVAAGCSFGDLFTIRTGGIGTIANPSTATSNTYTDPTLNNFYNAITGGLVSPNGNAGNIALVIGGKGAGQPPVVVISNTSTQITISPDWAIVPDATSIVVLLEAAPQITTTLPASQGLGNSAANYLLGNIATANYAATVIRVEAYLEDSNGTLGLQQAVAFREIYLWGAQIARYVTASNTLTGTTQFAQDGTILVDTTAVLQPATITVGTGGINSTSLTLPVSDGTNVENGTYLKVDTGGNIEYVLAVSGGRTAGATNITVARAQLSTTAVSHSAGVTIVVPGAFTIQLLAAVLVPNQKLALVKEDMTINYFFLQRGGTDTFPGGGTTRIWLSGTYYIQFPPA